MPNYNRMFQSNPMQFFRDFPVTPPNSVSKQPLTPMGSALGYNRP